MDGSATRFRLLSAVALVLAVSGCGWDPTAAKDAVTGGVTVQPRPAPGRTPAAPSRRIYVEDFVLDAERVETDEGLRGRVAPLQQMPRLRRRESPAEKARQLVEAMGEGLVRHLNEAGFTASRLAPGALRPKAGWLLRGLFTEVSEGNRVQRAMIGFGRGATSMEVQVTVSDLAGNPDAPFIVFGTVKDPSHLPGAVVTMNPFMAAARFAIEKDASARDVDRTAKEIVQEMLKYRDRFAEGAPAPPAR